MGILIIVRRGMKMDNISLIKKIEYNSKDIYPVTFELGYNLDRIKLGEIYQILKKDEIISRDKLNVDKNTFTIDLKLDKISEVASILIKNNIFFYGIYVLYDDYLEMKEVCKNE